MLLVSILIVLLFFCFQVRALRKTLAAARRLSSFFCKGAPYGVAAGSKWQISLDGILDGSDLHSLVADLNAYTRSARGVVDFTVVRDKTERRLSALEECAMSTVQSPTHLGLLGTFVGVFFGLWCFWSARGVSGVTDDGVYSLIQGVMVSMLTSAVGIVCLLLGRHAIASAQHRVAADRNAFYEWMQNELLPAADSSMISAVRKLNNVVEGMGTHIEGVLADFRKSFGAVAAQFGAGFSDSVQVVSRAVQLLGDNVDKMNTNIVQQGEMLRMLKSQEFAASLQEFVAAADCFKSSVSAFDDFERARDQMLELAHATVDLQERYMESLEVPRSIATDLNKILDRMCRFEEGINALGASVKESDVLGSGVLRIVQDHLTALEQKRELADRYLQQSDDELRELYSGQAAALDGLNARYRATLQRHLEALGEQLDAAAGQVKERRQAFFAQLERCFGTEGLKGDLACLQRLLPISEQTEAIAGTMSHLADTRQALDRLAQGVADIAKRIDGKGVPATGGKGPACGEGATSPATKGEETGWGWFGRKKRQAKPAATL